MVPSSVDVAQNPAALEVKKPVRGERKTASAEAKRALSGRFGSFVAVLIAVFWTIPTFGLFITSFRPEAQIKSSGCCMERNRRVISPHISLTPW